MARTRDERRALAERIIARSVRHIPWAEWIHHHRFAKTRKPCSCWMCGNPRRFFAGKERLTMQERRAAPMEDTHGR